jgi:hypothetical protein
MVPITILVFSFFSIHCSLGEVREFIRSNQVDVGVGCYKFMKARWNLNAPESVLRVNVAVGKLKKKKKKKKKEGGTGIA